MGGFLFLNTALSRYALGGIASRVSMKGLGLEPQKTAIRLGPRYFRPWLPGLDSDQDAMVQSHVSYH